MIHITQGERKVNTVLLGRKNGWKIPIIAGLEFLLFSYNTLIPLETLYPTLYLSYRKEIYAFI